MFDTSKSFIIMSDYVVSRKITAVVILKEKGFFIKVIP